MSDSNTKVKVSTDLPAEDMDLVRVLANEQGISVSEWLRRAVAAAIPKDLRARTRDTSLDEKVANFVDQQPSFPTIPLPPEAVALTEAAMNRSQDAYASLVQVRKKSEDEERKVLATQSTAPHACVYLSKETNPFYGPNDHEGTCKAPTQVGRVCFWPSAAAKSCPQFSPRREHVRK